MALASAASGVVAASRALFALAVMALLAAPAVAHVPEFAGDNASPGTAHTVDPPTTSWAIYDRLAGGQARYYELHLERGQRLELALFTPIDGEFTPSMVVMSPAIEGDATPPPGVTVPEGYGAVVVEGERPGQPVYEPFTPAASHETATFARRVEADARYLVAVYEPRGRTGPVGVVAGSRERFTARQHLTVAWDLPRIYLWEGRHPLVVFGPSLLAVAAALGVARRRFGGRDAGNADADPGRERGRRDAVAGTDRARWLRYAMAGAGALIVGSAAGVFVQMALALSATGPAAGALLTAVLVALPAVLGWLLVRLSLAPDLHLDGTARALLVVVGVGSLATWAGYLIAPLVPLAVAGWPGDPFD